MQRFNIYLSKLGHNHYVTLLSTIKQRFLVSDESIIFLESPIKFKAHTFITMNNNFQRMCFTAFAQHIILWGIQNYMFDYSKTTESIQLKICMGLQATYFPMKQKPADAKIGHSRFKNLMIPIAKKIGIGCLPGAYPVAIRCLADVFLKHIRQHPLADQFSDASIHKARGTRQASGTSRRHPQDTRLLRKYLGRPSIGFLLRNRHPKRHPLTQYKKRRHP